MQQNEVVLYFFVSVCAGRGKCILQVVVFKRYLNAV